MCKFMNHLFYILICQSPPETYLYPSRICYKLSLKDKALTDDVKIGDIETLTDGSVLYFKDLGLVAFFCRLLVFLAHSQFFK